MDNIQFIIFILTFAGFFIILIGLFIWNRTESRADMRHMDAKLESNRNLTIEIHKELKEEMKYFREIWFEESKDFHKRLCEIETRRSK